MTSIVCLRLSPSGCDGAPLVVKDLLAGLIATIDVMPEREAQPIFKLPRVPRQHDARATAGSGVVEVRCSYRVRSVGGWVELLPRYSMHHSEVTRSLKVIQAAEDVSHRPPRARPAPTHVHKLSARLSETTLQSILNDYLAGASALELAERHGLAKSAVLRLLHSRGIQVRPRGPHHR